MPHRLLPGPKGHWLLGSAADFRRDPLGFLTDTAERYGPLARFRLGPARVVLVSDAAAIERVLTLDPRKLRKPPFLRVMGHLVLGRALSASDGERWRKNRRIVTPAFHREAIDAYAATVAAVAREEAERLADGDVCDLEAAFFHAALRINARALFGVDPAADAERLAGALRAAIEGFGARVRSAVPTPDFVPVGHNRAMRSGMRAVRAFVHTAIGERRAARRGAHDLLALLMEARDDAGRPALADAEIADELAVMFGLGAHQTALAAAWSFALLFDAPRVLEDVRREIDGLGAAPLDGSSLASLRVTGAVVREALRLYPPFFVLAREALEPIAMGGATIETGTSIFVSPWVTQRSASYYDEPLAFRPERWLDGSAAARPRFAYFPFGGGQRLCPAQHFVSMQAAAMIASVIRRFDVAPAIGAPRAAPRASIALGTAGGVHARVCARRPAAMRACASC